jgi:hypothetical protein
MRSEADAQNIFRLLVNLLNTRGYYILEKRLRNYHGHIKNCRIVIDSAKSPTSKLRYLIHEGLHDVYPTWSETDIRKTTSEIFKGLSIRQMIKLGELYLRLVRRGKRRKNKVQE